MNTYAKNYWSLYLDFIQDFEKLKYNGLPLSYIVHFPSLIRKNTEIWNELHNKEFAGQLRNQVKDQKEFQEVFDKYIQSLKKKTFVKNKHGKVIIIADRLIRIPRKTFDDYFDPLQTLIIMTGTKLDKATNIPTKYISDYKSETKKAVIEGENQARAIFKSYEGHHLYKEENFKEIFLNKISAVINQIEIINNILGEVSASCIVVSSTNHFGRVVASVAAEKGIPTICMQHGIIGNEFGYMPKIATVDAVYGNFEVDWYKNLGVPKESLEIIGHPRFDQAFEPSTITKSKFDKQLGLDEGKKTLLIVVRGNRNIGKWKILIDTISNQLDINILIKDFPNDTPHALNKEFPFVNSTEAFDLYDILHNVDCVVSYTSTVALEAMLADKPVFILHNKLPSYTDYYNTLDELVQIDPQKLGELIIKYFNDPSWGGYVKEIRENFLSYAYPDFSKSSERLKNLIDRVMS